MSAELFSQIFPLWRNAFLMTLALEIPVFWLISRMDARVKGKVSGWRLALAGALGTCITHPLLWFVWPLVISDYTLYIASGELLVASLETLTFKAAAHPIRFRFALAASFAANAASFIIGMLINRTFA